MVAATDAAFAAAGPLLEKRRAEGFARRCHGDLHLGNILLEDGAPRLFDCIEFNDLLSEIDVLYDVAFLIMDLGFRGNATGANRALNAYLDEAARGFPPDLWDGLAALPLMLSARASVRAHVTAMQGQTEGARAYLAAAGAHLQPPPPRLVAVGGRSGSGKTTLARMIAPGLGAAPGAVVLRSDEIRKRLAGIGPLDHLPDDAYGPAMSERVYAELFATARRCLAAGRATVLDAVFLRPEERGAARRPCLRTAGGLRRRLAGRAPATCCAPGWPAAPGDASDADAAVLAAQLGARSGADRLEDGRRRRSERRRPSVLSRRAARLTAAAGATSWSRKVT